MTGRNITKSINYRAVTMTLLALYAALKERNGCQECGGTGQGDGEACHCTEVLHDVVQRFRQMGKLAELVSQTDDRNSLYSIAAPGMGLCYMVTAIRHLYVAAELCENCPICQGEGRLYEFAQESHEMVVETCACVTAVSAELTIWETCYRAALAAWLQWQGSSEEQLQAEYEGALERGVLERISWSAL